MDQYMPLLKGKRIGMVVNHTSVVETRFIIVAAAFVVVAVLFAVCSVSWSREADPDPAAPAPWLGIGLLPVMLSGLLVFAASFVMQLIF